MRKVNLLRPNATFGLGNPIPVGRTKFYEDFVEREGTSPFIPGTRIPRLRPVQLGPKAIAFPEDEIYAVTEALRAARDAS
jgi:hypothetical protein